ncbi:MAG: B12-binding domain-containing radical SAM protein [Desulfobacula sp.]|jgi:radical SAM superfamily enzyme YgiQ (UPF0313 family)|nr:B12-binding domain-containing radical SAM protein [Desulfobacula sp.]MBT6338601.1 B12-binding domain-containing radical SAM protein [Desulfobacula sp.]
MKIGLISPKGLKTNDNKLDQIFQNTSQDQSYIDSLSGAFGTGLLVISTLTPDHIEIEIIDENFDDIDFNKAYDLIGISVMTHQASRAYEIADEFRSRGITVSIGGIHATVLPEEAKRHCDSVFIGEAEHTWPVFLKDFKNGNVSDFYKSEKPVDMTSLLTPRYDLLKKENYKVIWMQTGRGCPHDCEFCVASNVYGHKYRHKTINQIIDEIKFIHKIWPNARINFADDNFLVNRKFSRELVKHLKKIDLRWFAQTDISIADDKEFIRELKEAGCTTLFIGFESVSKSSLSKINKNSWKLNQLYNYPEAIEKIQAQGIGIVGAFILGLDGDTEETFDELADFILENNIFIPQITVLTPLPGSRLYKRLKKENRLTDIPWSNYTFTEVNYIPKNMTGEDLKNGLHRVYKKVYSKEARLKVLKHFKNIFKEL